MFRTKNTRFSRVNVSANELVEEKYNEVYWWMERKNKRGGGEES